MIQVKIIKALPILLLIGNLNSQNIDLSTQDSILKISLWEKGTFFLKNRQPDSAKIVFKQLYIRQEDKLSPNEKSNYFNQLGVEFSDLGYYSFAEEYYNSAINCLDSTNRKWNPRYINAIYNLGYLFWEKRDYRLSVDYYKEALFLRKNYYGENSSEFSDCAYNLGLAYIDWGKYEESISLFKGLVINEINNSAVDSSNVCSYYQLLGFSYYELHDYIHSIYYYKKGLLFCNDDENRSYLNRDLGISYAESGDLFHADFHFSKALSIGINSDQELYANLCYNVGNFFKQSGFEETSELLEKAYKIQLQVNPDNISDLSLYSLNYVDLLLSQRKFKEAKKVSTYNLQLLNEYLSNNINSGVEAASLATDIEVHSILHKKLTDIYVEEKKFDLAEEELLKSLRAIEKYSNDLSDLKFDVYTSLCYLHYFDTEDSVKADFYFNHAFELADSIEFTSIRDAFYDLKNIYASHLLHKGELKKSYSTKAEVYQYKKENIKKNIAKLTSKQQKIFWDEKSEFFETVSGYSAFASDVIPESSKLYYDALLFSKSLLLQNQSVNVKSKYDNEISRLKLLKARQEIDENTDLLELGKTKKLIDSFEKLKSFANIDRQRFVEYTWKDIYTSLDSNEIAIEFDWYYDFYDTCNRYNAVILSKKLETPKVIKLCKESELESLNIKRDLDKIYNILLAPIAEYLSGIETIYYSPSGIVNNIPLQALITNTGNHYLAHNSTILTDNVRGAGSTYSNSRVNTNATYLLDSFQCIQLVSTRSIPEIKEFKSKMVDSTVMLLGGIDFSNFYGMDKGLSNIEFHDSFLYLPGTLNEVNHINELIIEKGYQTAVYSAVLGIEDSIFSCLRNNHFEILHWATHGYSYPIGLNKSDEKSNFLNGFNTNSNSMIRSGLLLSGSNYAWNNIDAYKSSGFQGDGILTADEIASLDLSHTQLAVLSACNTGIGSIDVKEGTIGLKRGFKLAGVKNLIVSLWEVPDLQTQELMKYFYEKLLSDFNIEKAFHFAQRKMRHLYPDKPHLWAAFILIK